MQQVWLKADNQNPWMGLSNQVCNNPDYWCRAHHIWLSKADAVTRHCFCKPTFDLRSKRKCNWLEVRVQNPFLHQ